MAFHFFNWAIQVFIISKLDGINIISKRVSLLYEWQDYPDIFYVAKLDRVYELQKYVTNTSHRVYYYTTVNYFYRQ